MAKLYLEWIILFIKIYKTGSVSRAAERRGLEQGMTSIAPNKLNIHFVDKLFSRTSRGTDAVCKNDLAGAARRYHLAGKGKRRQGGICP